MDLLSFKQYLPLKSSQFEIKTFELCESHSGYLWSFAVYTGKETILDSPIISKNVPNATAILLQLSEHLFHKDYTLWLDNYYNSEAMVKFLKSCNRDFVGTVKANRKAVTARKQTAEGRCGNAARWTGLFSWDVVTRRA